MLAPKPFMELIKEMWPVFSEHWTLTIGGPAMYVYVPLVVVGIPICVIAFILGAVILFISHKNMGLYWVAMFPIGLIGVILYALAVNKIRAAFTKIVLRILRGKKPVFSDMVKPVPFWNFFLTLFIIGVATAIGGFCLIVPGIYIAVRTAFAPFLVIDQKLGPIEAIMKSNELVTGYGWQVLGCVALLWFANLAAGFIPGLHLIMTPATMGYYDLLVGQMYLWRKKETSGDL